MENKDTKAIDDNSGHVSKFFKLSPDSISKFNKEKNLVKKMNQDICEITEKITEKMAKINNLNSKMLRLNDSKNERRYREARNEKLQRELYMTLDELNIMSKANGEWFQEKLDKNSLDYLKLHGSKSLAEEKQVLRDLKIQQKDVASFKSPSQLLINSSFAYTIHKLTHKREDKMFWWTVENLEQIRSKYNLSAEEKLFIEIEQLRIQHLERIKVTYVKGNIPKYKSLKKSIEDRIKGLCDDSLRDRRECLEYWTRVRQNVKEFEALDREINYLVGKLRMRHNKRDEAYQRIFKLQHEELPSNPQDILALLSVGLFAKSGYKKRRQIKSDIICHSKKKLAEERDGAVLDEMSNSEIGKFILEWNNNKAFRDYEDFLLQSFERQQQCRDERNRTYERFS
ncbi:hypothetical protein QL285_034936 [Trifolium repens]|nr:hypothetical protein QL285_034936 [Trifolium repens]